MANPFRRALAQQPQEPERALELVPEPEKPAKPKRGPRITSREYRWVDPLEMDEPTFQRWLAGFTQRRD